MHRSILAVTAALVLGLAPARSQDSASAVAPWQTASAWPDRIVLGFAGDTSRTVAVNWRTSADVGPVEAQIVRATPDARFDLGARSVPATSEIVELDRVVRGERVFDMTDNTGLAPVAYHSAVFEGLEPNTLYAYRVGGGNGQWSEWFQVRTGPEAGPITFLYMGDAQDGILSHWARTIRGAYAAAPDARFVIHAGDLVNRGPRDFEWAQWFKAVGFIHGMVPAIPVVGNHEHPLIRPLTPTNERLLSLHWRPQFTLPVDSDLPEALAETAYSIRYGSELEVFVLNSNVLFETQARWLDKRLAASTARWRVATFHHPIFSSGSNRDNDRLRAVFLPVLRKHQVDLVLQGHDHTYARGTLLQSAARQRRRNGEAVVSMFVNSVAGAKQYEFAKRGWEMYAQDAVRLDRRAENSQLFQVVRINGRELTLSAYGADGTLYDAFRLVKDARGRKRLFSAGSVAAAQRAFDNTAPYPGAERLND